MRIVLIFYKFIFLMAALLKTFLLKIQESDWLWIRSPLQEMKYLFKCIFLFHHSGIEAKRGVEFRHSTRNASRISERAANFY